MKRLSIFAISLVLAVLVASFSDARAQSSPVVSRFCVYAPETDTDMNIEVRRDGRVSGEFFLPGCGSGPLFGYAQFDVDTASWWGKLFIYTDILGDCPMPGAFYSVDVRDMAYRWQSGPYERPEKASSAESAEFDPYKRGFGLLEVIKCAR